jgi:uncharacterized protein YacL
MQTKHDPRDANALTPLSRRGALGSGIGLFIVGVWCTAMAWMVLQWWDLSIEVALAGAVLAGALGLLMVVLLALLGDDD